MNRWTFEINFRPDGEAPVWILAMWTFPTFGDAGRVAGLWMAAHYEEHGTCPSVRLRELPAPPLT